MPDRLTIPEVLIPKAGVRTSSFYVLLAAWLVGGLFTGAFVTMERKGYLDREGSETVRGWLIQSIAELLPVAYLAVSGWVTKQYIAARGRLAERKAEAMGAVVMTQTASADNKGS